MTRPPRDPAAPLLPRAAVVRSSAAGALLAASAFGLYWWESSALGESQARASALIALLAAYQALLFAERLALPESLPRMPRTPVFWTVWIACLVSLVVIPTVPSVADLFRVASPSRDQVVFAAAIGMLSVGWRFLPQLGPRRQT